MTVIARVMSIMADCGEGKCVYLKTDRTQWLALIGAEYRSLNVLCPGRILLFTFPHIDMIGKQLTL